MCVHYSDRALIYAVERKRVRIHILDQTVIELFLKRFDDLQLYVNGHDIAATEK